MSPAIACRRRTGLPAIGLQVLLIAFLGFMTWGIPKHVAAQDAPKGKEQGKALNEGSGEGFFDRGPVDFWETKKKSVDRNQNQPASATTNRSETRPEAAAKWTESVTSENGQVTRHTPSPIVIDLLEDPSEANARRYLQWQREKLQKILRAQEAVERVQAQLVREQQNKSADLTKAENPPNGKDSPSQHPQEIQSPKSLPPAPSKPVPQESLVDLEQCELVFFYQPGCPHCMTQAKILNHVIAKHPKLEVAAVNTSERQELAMAFGVDATPTLIVKTKSKPQMLRLEGVTTYESLLRATQALIEGPTK
jgi:thiol-disulfide isomerase/thioredoxin